MLLDDPGVEQCPFKVPVPFFQQNMLLNSKFEIRHWRLNSMLGKLKTLMRSNGRLRYELGRKDEQGSC